MSLNAATMQDSPTLGGESIEVQAVPKAPAKPRKGRSKSEQRAETLELILNAAELLFSKHGFYGVTLKDVAQVVGVHTSLLHYYFENKQSLFDAVLMRRAPVTIARRKEAMEAYDLETGGKPTVEGALRAFLDSDLDLYINGDDGWKNYAAMGAQISNTPAWGAEIMDRLFDPLVLQLITLLKKALPDAADEDIFWGYNFVTGALMLTVARTGRIDKLSGGLCNSDDYEAVKTRMATFMAAGLIAVCEQQAAKRTARQGELA